MQSALRTTLSPLLVVVVFALASAAFGQSHAIATSTTLTTARASDGSGKTIFTVQVSPAPQAADSSENADHGSVTVEENGSDNQPHSLGSAFVDAEGNATLTVPTLSVGIHNVRAVYSGTESAASSTSETKGITSEAAAPDFSLTASPSTLNLTAGLQSSVAITIPLRA